MSNLETSPMPGICYEVSFNCIEGFDTPNIQRYPLAGQPVDQPDKDWSCPTLVEETRRKARLRMKEKALKYEKRLAAKKDEVARKKDLRKRERGRRK